VFADRAVPARLRGERHHAIVHDQLTPGRWARLINTELQDLRTYLFMELANELRRTVDRFAGHKVQAVVLDTNDLLHYSRFDNIPWQRLFGPGTSVMIPHVMIDEIDKKSFDTNDTGTRSLRPPGTGAHPDRDGWPSVRQQRGVRRRRPAGRARACAAAE
jgi:hypothetical protein